VNTTPGVYQARGQCYKTSVTYLTPRSRPTPTPTIFKRRGRLVECFSICASVFRI